MYRIAGKQYNFIERESDYDTLIVFLVTLFLEYSV